MKILTSANNLENYLRGIKGKDVRIVTAFATNTERLVLEMARANRSVELIVGTINSFTSPTFLRALADKISPAGEPGLSLHVDFRGAKSVHWKLALVSPATVVIGSANLTETGLALERDTCITLTDKNLYDEYSQLVDGIRDSAGVVSAAETGFDKRLDRYEDTHNRMQAGLQFASASTGKQPSLAEWLADEANDTVKLYVWQRDHSERDKKLAGKIVKTHFSTVAHAITEKADRAKYRDFFTNGDLDSTFDVGDIVICANRNGSHLDFFTFDIVHRQKRKSGDRDVMISLRQPRYRRLFDLAPLKKRFQAYIKETAMEGKYVMRRVELIERILKQGVK